jgi:ribonuclease E
MPAGETAVVAPAAAAPAALALQAAETPAAPAQAELDIALPAAAMATAEPLAAQAVAEAAPEAPPAVVPPPVTPQPMPLEALKPVLEEAGLTLVQTEPSKLADVLARFANEPKPVRVPRQRPALPPLEVGPLVQVETRRSAAPPM